MPTGTLSGEGKALWEKVYDKALKGSCKGDKECAARTAWSAVKGAGWSKDSDGKWHKKTVLSQFSLAITRASYDKALNRMNWRAVTSDTETDFFNDNMTLELFRDFIERIDSGEKPPEKFRSDFWSGGLPYMSLSHYPDLNGKAVPGMAEKVYIDGNCFKATGYFSDNVLGRACFKAINKDLYGGEENPDGKVRISIAFLDYAHRHKSTGHIFERSEDTPICMECLKEALDEAMGEGEKSKDGVEFLKGQLVHLALTRVPANERTLIEPTEVDKMAIKTRKDDALSIIGDDEEAQKELEEIAEEASIIGRSELVIKSEEQEDEDVAEVEEEVEIEAEELELDEPEEIVEEATTKKEGSMKRPSSDYLVVEDSSKPSTWHLPVKNHGKPDHRLMAAARAALTSNYRGHSYSGPKKAEALRKLKALYKREGMSWESLTMEDVWYELGEMKSMIEDMQVEPEAHPLDDLISTFKSAYDAALLVDGTADEKLQALQDPFNTFSQTIVERIKAIEPEEEVEVERSEASVDVVVNEVMKRIGPQFEELKSLLKPAQSAADPNAPVPVRDLVHRRSFLPQPTVPQQTLQKPKSGVKSIREVVEQTT